MVGSTAVDSSWAPIGGPDDVLNRPLSMLAGPAEEASVSVDEGGSHSTVEAVARCADWLSGSSVAALVEVASVYVDRSAILGERDSLGGKTVTIFGGDADFPSDNVSSGEECAIAAEPIDVPACPNDMLDCPAGCAETVT